MRRFKWIEWNVEKVAAHQLSPEEVEAAFDLAYDMEERRDGSFLMYAKTPAGRPISVIWRYDREDEGIPNIFGEVELPPIFVITAY